jgi:hypothetical protein
MRADNVTAASSTAPGPFPRKSHRADAGDCLARPSQTLIVPDGEAAKACEESDLTISTTRCSTVCDARQVYVT